MTGQETVSECIYKNAIIRVHFPDRTKEEQTEKVKIATEKFLKKVERIRKGDKHGN